MAGKRKNKFHNANLNELYEYAERFHMSMVQTADATAHTTRLSAK
jgi:hypothetical protein